MGQSNGGYHYNPTPYKLDTTTNMDDKGIPRSFHECIWNDQTTQGYAEMRLKPTLFFLPETSLPRVPAGARQIGPYVILKHQQAEKAAAMSSKIATHSVRRQNGMKGITLNIPANTQLVIHVIVSVASLHLQAEYLKTLNGKPEVRELLYLMSLPPKTTAEIYVWGYE